MSGIIPLSDLTLTDRTRTTEDWKCRRRRWLGYEVDGIGLISDGLQLELFLGTVIHDSLAAIATGQAIDLIASTAYSSVYTTLAGDADPAHEENQWCLEQASLVEGLIRGFYRHVWPRLRTAYPVIVAVEPEVTYDVGSGIIFMSRPDLLVEDASGELHIIEYKSTSSKKEQWINSWSYAVQLHSTVRAIEATLGRQVASVQVVGLYKGYESYGKLNTPLCWAYRKAGNPPFSTDQLSYEYKAGFYKTGVWDLPGKVKGWIEGMPPNILASQFPMTPPIFVKDELVDGFFRQLHLRELEIRMAHDMLRMPGVDKQEVLDVSFPQSWEQCSPGWGHECPFKRICHGSLDEPLKHGYTYRQPHHQMEIEKYVELEAEREAQVPEGAAEGIGQDRSGSLQGAADVREGVDQAQQ